MTLAFLFLATCFLAYSNGANDNFKGVASLFGSRTSGYRVAIGWATVTTLAGSIAAAFFAQALPMLSVVVDKEALCSQRYAGAVLGINAGRLLDTLHFLSAGAVSFARG